jgi:hypothetical protein
MRNIENFDCVNMENSIDWEVCFVKLVNLFEVKGGKMKDCAISIIKSVIELLGKEIFSQIVNSNVKDKEMFMKVVQISEEGLKFLSENLVIS